MLRWWIQKKNVNSRNAKHERSTVLLGDEASELPFAFINRLQVFICHSRIILRHFHWFLWSDSIRTTYIQKINKRKPWFKSTYIHIFQKKTMQEQSKKKKLESILIMKTITKNRLTFDERSKTYNPLTADNASVESTGSGLEFMETTLKRLLFITGVKKREV